MTRYFDLSKLGGGCYGIIADPGDQIVYTGTRIHQEPAKYRGTEPAERLARESDLHFWYTDERPEVGIYTVPRLEIGGYDRRGGFFAGSPDFSLRGEETLYYIDRDSRCFQIDTDNFPGMGLSWQETMVPTDEIEIFASFEKAAEQYTIHWPENDADLLKLLKGAEA